MRRLVCSIRGTESNKGRFVAQYRKAGGRVDLELFEDEGQAFISRNPGSSNARRAIERIIDFVHKQA